VIIGKHPRKRWIERVNPGAASMVPEELDTEIQAAFDKAAVVHEEEENGEQIQYRVLDDIFFIYNIAADKLITLVDIDFGFSPEVNLTICRVQTERVLGLKERIAAETKQVELSCADIDHKLLAVDDEIAELDARLAAARATRGRLELQKAEKSKGLEALKAEFASDFNRLKYSIRYRVESQKGKKVS